MFLAIMLIAISNLLKQSYVDHVSSISGFSVPCKSQKYKYCYKLPPNKSYSIDKIKLNSHTHIDGSGSSISFITPSGLNDILIDSKKNITIENLKINSNSHNYSISIKCSSNIKISHVEVSGWKKGLQIASFQREYCETKNITLNHLFIHSPSKSPHYPLAIQYVGGSSPPRNIFITNSRIFGNKLPFKQGGTADLVAIQGAHNVLVSKNYLYDGGEIGIAVSRSSYNVQIISNQISNVDWAGIQIGSSANLYTKSKKSGDFFSDGFTKCFNNAFLKKVANETFYIKISKSTTSQSCEKNLEANGTIAFTNKVIVEDNFIDNPSIRKYNHDTRPYTIALIANSYDIIYKNNTASIKSCDFTQHFRTFRSKNIFASLNKIKCKK